MRALIVFLTGGVLLCGCATTPQFDGTPLDGIRNGVTTEAQLREWLGPPHDQSAVVDKESGRIYIYKEVKAFKVGSDRKVSGYTGTMTAPERKFERKLTIELNAAGVVKDWDLEQRTIRPGHR